MAPLAGRRSSPSHRTRLKRRTPERPPRLLLTGFGPFPGVPVNPTTAIVNMVATRQRVEPLPARLDAVILPTEWRALADLGGTIETISPDAIVMTGVAGSAAVLRLERTARNRTTKAMPDAAGDHPREGRLAEGRGRIITPLGPGFGRFTNALATLGTPHRISDDAGDYLCNAAFFTALSVTGPRVPVVFVHVPPVRAGRHRRIADMAAAVREVARQTLEARAQRGV